MIEWGKEGASEYDYVCVCLKSGRMRRELLDGERSCASEEENDSIVSVSEWMVLDIPLSGIAHESHENEPRRH